MRLTRDLAQPMLDKFTPDEISFIQEWLLAIDDQCATPTPTSPEMGARTPCLYIQPPTLHWCAMLLKQKKE